MTTAFRSFFRFLFQNGELCVLSLHIVVLDDDVAILIRLVFPKLNVSPLHGNELAAAKARAQCHKKERVIFRAGIFCGLEKLLGLGWRQRNSLDLCGLRGPREAAEARRRVRFDNPCFDGLVKYPANHAQRVSDGVAREFFGDQLVDHRLDIVALDLIQASIPEARPEILLAIALTTKLVSTARSVFQNQSGVLQRHYRSLFLAEVRPIHGVNALAESDQVGVRTTTGVNASLHHLLKAPN
jgi:hypothetical protein